MEEYRLGEQGWRTRFALVVVARLLGLTGARTLVLAMRPARERWYGEQAAELQGAGPKLELIEISG
jgi:hypothetical protein